MAVSIWGRVASVYFIKYIDREGKGREQLRKIFFKFRSVNRNFKGNTHSTYNISPEVKKIISWNNFNNIECRFNLT
jgi:hypothetical protein